jgi:putative FmdB family regulatory protein
VPTYQYRCTQCGNELEVVQKFTDPALSECDECHGALRKVYNAVGVVFKGSGFYRTDSRKADGKGSTNESKPGEKGSGEKRSG